MLASVLRSRSCQLRSLCSFVQKSHSNIIPFGKIPTGSQSVTIAFTQKKSNIQKLSFSVESTSRLDPLKFDEVCSETLESLCEYFEEIVETNTHFQSPDVVYGDGVLTVAFGEPYGTYVINRQTPNKQIWLSSPTSGPKRYDFVEDKGKEYWIYKHDGKSLHQLLQKEISLISKLPVDFAKCTFSLV